MKKIISAQAVARSRKIRESYHRLELQHHGSKWTTEEDGLAFLTDAALVGRLTMARQGRWPVESGTADRLEHKLGECIWWLIVLAERMDIDVEKALDAFLTTTEKQLSRSLPTTPPKRKAPRRLKPEESIGRAAT